MKKLPKKIILDILGQILWRQHIDKGHVNRVGVARESTKALPQIIASIPAPPMEVLIERHEKREKMKLN